MKPSEVAKQLGPRTFIALCTLVDSKFGLRTKFDITEIKQVEDHFEVALITEYDKEMQVRL